MAVDTPAKIAVLGAGPIGLEAALYARFLGYDVVLYERGEVCQHVRDWGHLRMVTPFGENRSLLGAAAIQAQDEAYKPPADDAVLTGREWLERYLMPLSQTDLLSDHLRLGTTVLAVGKEFMSKPETPGHEDRGDWSFRVLTRDAAGVERSELADVVFDTTGVLGQPNWIGDGGIPAVGELGLSERIERRFPDFLGKDRQRYAGRHTLLVGSDWTAAYNALGLADLLREEPGTKVTWVLRGDEGAPGDAPPLKAEAGDPPGRAELIAAANGWATSGAQGLAYWPGTVVEAIRRAEDGNGVAVTLSGSQSGEFTFDEVVASVGFRPDRAIFSELQVRECFATERTVNLESAGGSAGQELVHPEANFYVLGAKSFGRGGRFCVADGLNQIRELFKLIGDRETLDLYAGAVKLLR